MKENRSLSPWGRMVPILKMRRFSCPLRLPPEMGEMAQTFISEIDFLLFDRFIAFVFVQHVRTKAVTSHLFTPLFMFVHLPLIHLAPPPRLLHDRL